MRLIRRYKKAEVNIVPLVDVLTVLIFFFLITMSFRKDSNENVVNITPPEMESAENSKSEESLVISIDKSGKIFVGNLDIPIQNLKSILQKESKSSVDRPVLIIADEDSYLKNATCVLDLCKQCKFKKIRLKAR